MTENQEDYVLRALEKRYPFPTSRYYLAEIKDVNLCDIITDENRLDAVLMYIRSGKRLLKPDVKNIDDYYKTAETYIKNNPAVDNYLLPKKLKSINPSNPSDDDKIFNMVMEDSYRCGALFYGVRFKTEADLNNFLENLRKVDGISGRTCLTSLLYVAEAFANRDDRFDRAYYPLILVVDPKRIVAQKVIYSDRNDIRYDRTARPEEAEVRTNQIPKDAVKGVLILPRDFTIKCDDLDLRSGFMIGARSYIGIPNIENVQTYFRR